MFGWLLLYCYYLYDFLALFLELFVNKYGHCKWSEDLEMSQPDVYYPNQKNDCLIFLSFNYMEIKDLAFNINCATDER